MTKTMNLAFSLGPIGSFDAHLSKCHSVLEFDETGVTVNMNQMMDGEGCGIG